MPILSWFYFSELNESWRFLGTCDYRNRDTYQERIDNLVAAMGWDAAGVVCKHHYLNSIRDDLTQL